MLCDRLWQNSGIVPTLTTEQVFTGAAQIPARDNNGTNAGDGVFGAVEVSSAMGSAAPTITLKYTNTLAGTSTGNNITPTTTTSPAGVFHPFALAAGDVGVQKAQSIQFSTSWLSGTCHVVLFRVLAKLELTGANIPNAIDAFTSGFPSLFNNSVPFLVFIPNTTTASYIGGSAIWSQG